MTTPFPEPFDVQWEYTEADETVGNRHMRVLPGQRHPTYTDWFSLPAGSYMLTATFKGKGSGQLETYVDGTHRKMLDIPASDNHMDRLIGTTYFSIKRSRVVRPWILNGVQTTNDMFTLKVVRFPTYDGI